jgi:hypothetical protein
MPESIVRIRELPHFRVPVCELATWLDQQDEKSWWSVDGEPFLTERISFPCPGHELAHVLKRFDKTLLLLDPRERSEVRGDELSAGQLDEIAYVDKQGDRAFQFCWEDGPDVDWILFEDREIGRLSLEHDHPDHA